MRHISGAAAVLLAAMLGYMAAGYITWAVDSSPALTATQAQQDLSLVTGLPSDQISASDRQSGSPAQPAAVPFTYPHSVTQPWWATLLGSDEYGATGYSAELTPGTTWSPQEAEQRLRAAGWTTHSSREGEEQALTATSPQVPGETPRVLSLSTWQSSLRVDLLREAPPYLHVALLAGTVLVAGLATVLVATARRGRRYAVAAPSRRPATQTAAGEVIAAVAAAGTVLGGLALTVFTAFTALATAPVWTSAYGAAAVAPWAPLMTIGARQLLILGLALLVLGWLLPLSTRHLPVLRGAGHRPQPQS